MAGPRCRLERTQPTAYVSVCVCVKLSCLVLTATCILPHVIGRYLHPEAGPAVIGCNSH